NRHRRACHLHQRSDPQGVEEATRMSSLWEAVYAPTSARCHHGLGRGGLRGLLPLWASSGCRTGGVAALSGITMNDAIIRHGRESIGVKGDFPTPMPKQGGCDLMDGDISSI